MHRSWMNWPFRNTLIRHKLDVRKLPSQKPPKAFSFVRQGGDRIQQFISTLAAHKDLITDFDPTLWGVLLDHMTVFSKEDIRFTFRDGTEIKV